MGSGFVAKVLAKVRLYFAELAKVRLYFAVSKGTALLCGIALERSLLTPLFDAKNTTSEN